MIHLPRPTESMKRQAFKAAQRQLATLLGAINLSTIPDIPQLIQAVGAMRNHRIQLVPLVLPPDLTGAWIRTDVLDMIYFSYDAPEVLRDHIVLHELGHLVFGHKTLVISPELSGRPCTDFPLLTPTMDDLQQALNRSCYDTQQELEAELFAMCIKQAWRTLSPQQDEWSQVQSLARPEDRPLIERVRTFDTTIDD